MFLYSLLRLLPVRDLNSSAPAKRSVVRRLLAAQIRANGEWERRRLLLLLNVIAKCPEAFVCDLGQRDAIDLIDPIDLGLQFSRNSNRQASTLLDVGLPEGFHGSHTNIYGSASLKLRLFLHRMQKFHKRAG